MVLTDGRAHAIQIARTTSALARCGAAVTLTVRRGHRPVAEGAAMLGLDPSAGPAIDAFRWKRRARLPLARRLLARRMASAGGGPPVVYLRQVEDYSWFLARFARRIGLPVVYEAHSVKTLLMEEAAATGGGRPSGFSPEEWERMEADLFRLASGVVFTAPLTEGIARKRFSFDAPTLLAPNATPAGPAVVAGPVDAARDLDVLYVGQLYRWKGFDLLLEAMARMPGRTLTVAGGGVAGGEELAAARERAAELGVGERVTFLGQVAPDDVASLMARARAGVIPLPSEGSVEARSFTAPLKLFEYRAAGVPVVATDLPSIRALVDDGRTGLVVPSEPGAIAAALERLRGDPDLASRLAAAGRKLAASATWDDRARRILDFIEPLVR